MSDLNLQVLPFLSTSIITMHLELVEQRPSRKGKEREPISRDNMVMREPQPTDLDEKLTALRRRTAACVVYLSFAASRVL